MLKQRRWLAAATVGLALASGPAWGQYQVRQGQVLDANKMVGSGGLNQARGALQFDTGNQIISGNVASGLSFRGYSPIRDPSSFYMGPSIAQGSGLLGRNIVRSALGPGAGSASGYYLPSQSLYAFQRDSYGIGDYRAGRQAYGGATPYYSPSATILNAGALAAGQNRPGTSQIQNPYQTPTDLLNSQRTSLLASVQESAAGGNLLSVPSRVVRTTTGQPVAGPVDYRLMSNPLFAGAYREMSAREIADQMAPPGQYSVSARPGGQAQPGPGPRPPAEMQGPADLRINAAAQDLRVKPGGLQPRRMESPDDARLREVLARAAEDGEYTGWQPNSLTGPGKTQLLGPKGGEVRTGGGAKSGARAGGPGDFYTWMRQTSETRAMMGQARGVAGTEGQAGTPAAPGPRPAPGAGTALTEALNSQEPGAVALKTFVGTELTALNTQLKYAEEALSTGRYYRAAEAYSLARTVAPDNPLPALGQCLALLAAGDFVTSASSLFESIQLFGSLSDFELDMKSFVQDIQVLDSQRAKIEKLLATRDNGRLRFLLGFAEYNSGLKKLGVKNLQNGLLLLSDRDGDLTAVRRFVENLEAKVGISHPVPAPPSP